jgi:RimJ/RimL family protein N-acetyltransferase
VGTRKEGFLAENLKIHGVWKSSFLYAMLVEEWNGAALKLPPESGSGIG